MCSADLSVGSDCANQVLSACSATTRAALFECGDIREFTSKSILFHEGERVGKVMFLLEGRLQIDKTGGQGRRQVLCTMTPCKCSGICILLMSDNGLADVHAQAAGRILIVSQADFVALTRQDEALCRAGWNGAAECLAHLSNLVGNLSFHKVAQRVAATLIGRAEMNGDLVKLTQAGLAAEVGTTREVVARSLSGMQTAGVIRLGRGHITVVNREKLGQMT